MLRRWWPSRPYVAHGYQALDLRDVLLNYYVTEPYDAEDPDEGRIAWNDPRIGFDWTDREHLRCASLVTGGAGFIGSEFVRMTLPSTREIGAGPRQAHLRG